MTSAQIRLALARHFDPFRNLMLFEAPITCRDTLTRQPSLGYTYQARVDYLADLLVITPNDYATEIEIKISRGDWRADKAKRKWEGGLPDWICRFMYAVPAELGLPDWIPEKCGVIHVGPSGWHDDGVACTVVRSPGRFGKEKVPEAVKRYMLNRTYARYWQQQYTSLWTAHQDHVKRAAQKAANVAAIKPIIGELPGVSSAETLFHVKP